MGVHVLPLRPDLPHYRFEVELDGVAYGIELRWNMRAEGWMMTLSTPEGDVLLRRRVVLGFPLTARYRDLRLPAGELEAIDTEGTGVEPGLRDLGGRVLILYTDAESLPDTFLTPAPAALVS